MSLGMSAVLVCGTHEIDLTRTVCTGPNTAGGHASVFFNEEVQVRQNESSLSRRTRHLVRVCQIQHTMQLIKPILTGAVRSFSVREEASSKYNSWVQKQLARTVWKFATRTIAVRAPRAKSSQRSQGL